jgi:hypothetical protein
MGGRENMIVCYLSNDSEIVAERCRISLSERSPMTLFAVDGAGCVAGFTGVVLSMRFDPGCAVGMRWRVEMDISTVASPDLIPVAPSGRDEAPAASGPARPASRTDVGDAPQG